MQDFDPLRAPSTGSQLTAQALEGLGQMLPTQAPPLTAEKQQHLAKVSEAKQLAMGGGQNFDVLATAVLEGNDIGQHPMVQEMASTSVGELRFKYDEEVAALASGLQDAIRRVDRERRMGRSPGQVSSDSLLGIGAGVTTGLGGIAALGAGLVNEDAGAAVSGATNAAASFLRDNQSHSLNRRRELGGIRSGLDQEDINRQYTEDQENGDDYAGLKRFGREALSKAADFMDNPALAGDVITEGVGSIISTAGMTQIAARGAAKALLKRRGITDKDAIRDLTQELAVKGVPGTIGIQEGGGAYVQIQEAMRAEIGEMSEAELAEVSPEYATMRQQGMPHDAAVNRLVNASSLQGAALQGAIGAATGKAVAGFEANPLRVGSGSFSSRLSSFGGTLLKESTEEGVQETSVGIVEGDAIRRAIDPDRDILAGAGADFVTGVTAGAGMAGTLQAPGLTASAAKAAAIGTAKGTAKAISNRLSDAQASAEEEAGIGRSDQEQAFDTVRELSVPAAPVVAAAPVTPTEPVVEEAAVPEEALQESTDIAEVSQSDTDRVFEMSAEELSEAPDSVRSMVEEDGSGVPRMDMMQAVLNEITGPEMDAAAKVEASLWLKDQAEEIKSFRDRDISALDEETQERLGRTIDAMDVILELPPVKAALEQAAKADTASVGGVPQVTAENVDSPEVQNAMRKQALLASSNPAGVDPDFIDAVLDQKSGLQLPARLRKTLRAAAVVARQVKEEAEAKAALAAKQPAGKKLKTTSIVGAEVRSDDVNEKGQAGIAKHVADINAAMKRGDKTEATISLQKLGNFAQHFQNKLAAADESRALNRRENNSISYRTWTGNAWVEADDQAASSIYIAPGSRGSEALLAEIKIDAAAVLKTFESMKEIYKDELSVPKDLLKAELKELSQELDETNKPVKPERRLRKDAVLKTSESLIDQEETSDAGQDNTDAEETSEPTGSDEVSEPDGGTPADQESGTDEAEGSADAGSEGRAPELDLSNLVGTRLANTYDFDTSKSELMQAPAGAPVIGGVQAAVDDAATLDLPYNMDDDKSAALGDLVSRVTEVVSKMNARLDQKQPTIRGGELSPLEAFDPDLNGGTDFTSIRETRMLNILDQETAQYDERLAQVAALAGLHWVMNQQGTANLDLEDVARIFKVQPSQVTPSMVRALNTGLTQTTAQESVAATILEFWGAVAKADAPISDTAGIAQGVAAEVLVAMEGIFVERTQLDIPALNNPISVRPTHEATKDLVAKLGPARSFLKDAFLPGSEPDYFIGTPPEGTSSEKRPGKQKGNKLGRNNAAQEKALAAHRRIPHKPNMPFLNLMGRIGVQGYMRLMGAVEYDVDTTHERHAESLEGKNVNLRNAFLRTMDHMARVEKYAADRDLEIDDVPSFFEHYIAKNGRVMAKGFTPQSDKTMRQAVNATVSTLDLTTEEGQAAFWLTVAQALGVKTEKEFRVDAVAKAREMVRETFPKSLTALNAWLEDGDSLPADVVDTLDSEMSQGGGDPEVTLHALISVARHDEALRRSNEDPQAAKTFRHQMSLEADGKTDGPINAMLHFIQGEFDETQIRNLRKGGFFPGVLGKTLNQQSKEDASDLYEAAANRHKSNLDMLRQILPGNEKGHMDRMLRVLDQLGDISFDGEEITIGRNVLKNPLTITVYGSGAAGIAGKIAGALSEVLYARFSEILAERKATGNPNIGLGDRQLEDDLGFLFTARVVRNPVTRKREITNLHADRKPVSFNWGDVYNDLKRAQIGSRNFDMLRDTIESLFVEPMVHAISIETGGATETTKLLEQATQIQSAVFIEHFWNAVRKMVADKRANGEIEKNAFLSKQDYDRVFNEMSKFAAVVEATSGAASDARHIHLSGNERVLSDWDFARGLGNEYNANSTLSGPSDASVGVTPGLTISRGDAEMMVGLFAGLEEENLRVGQVFDGLDMAADLIDTMGQKVNEAWVDAILKNPVTDAVDSYADFMNQTAERGGTDPLDGVTSYETYRKLWRAFSNTDPAASAYWKKTEKAIIAKIGKPPKANAPVAKREDWSRKAGEEAKRLLEDDTRALMLGTKDRLTQANMEIEARKRVFRSMQFSGDHMASAESPANHDGAVPDTSSDDALVAWMEEQRLKELNALQAERVASDYIPTIQEPDPVFSSFIEEVALPETTKIDGTGSAVQLIHADDLLTAMRSKAKKLNLTREHLQVIKALGEKMPDFRMVIGDRDALTEYRDNRFPDRRGEAPVDLGRTDLRHGVIYVANASPETVLHEMLHALTAASFYEYHANVAGTDAEKDSARWGAVRSLERLMEQFRDLSFESDNGSVKDAAETVLAEIETAIAENPGPAGKTKAMLEFVSWILTNQNLSQKTAKTKVRRRLSALKDAALAGLRKLIGLPPKASLDMFSNVLWNTAAVIRLDPSQGQSTPPALSLDQVSPSNSRLKRIIAGFENKISRHLRDSDPKRAPGIELAAKQIAHTALNRVTKAGFVMTPQQQSAFRSIHVALATQTKLDNGALIEAQKLFGHALRTFEKVKSSSGTLTSGQQKAKDKLEVLVGQDNREVDQQGRSTLLPTFLGLVMVDDDLRGALRSLPVPTGKTYKSILKGESLDDALNSMANKALDRLSNRIVRQSANTTEAVDELTLALAEIEAGDQTLLEKKASGYMDAADEKLSGWMSEAGKKAWDWARGDEDKSIQAEMKEGRSKLRASIRTAGLALGAALNDDKAKILSEAAVSVGNETNSLPKFLTEMVSEIVGITDSNRKVYQLINRVRYAVSALRQDWRQTVIEIIRDHFSDEPSQADWESMHEGLARTDLASLADMMSSGDIREILQDGRKRSGALENVRKDLRKLAPREATIYETKARELAKYMVTGEIDPGNNHLLMNAFAIARLPGIKPTFDPAQGVEEAISHMISLLALEYVKPESMETIKRLAETEPEAIEFTLGFLNDLRKKEMAKATTVTAKMNGLQGYVPAETAEGAVLTVIPDSEGPALIARGYTRVGDYRGSGLESGKRGYYFSAVGGNSMYQQGVMQTVHRTAMGVNPLTGYTTDGRTAGRVASDQVQKIRGRILKGNSPKRGEPLIPVIDGKGQVRAYQRHIAPDQREALQPNRHLGEMMGAWAGRQKEEEAALFFNAQLIQSTHKVWKEAQKSGRTSEFVDLSGDVDDPVWRETWSMVPSEMKAEIKRVFGEDGFMVRKDMINNVMGYRSASISDVWSDNNRMNKQVKKAVHDVSVALLGNKAYSHLVTLEKGWQTGISVAKQTIIIRSIVVPVANAASNVLQLMTLGVPIRSITTGTSKKLREVDQFQKYRRREMEIVALLGGVTDAAEKRRLETELKTIGDATKRLSIAPLIQEGELSTISEGLSDADAALTSGRWYEWASSLAERLPAKLGTVGRYAAMTKDTALFQGLNRAVQYGDFLAKAVLYDHLTGEKGLSHEEAMKRVTDEFINYNLLPGRARSYAESMGASWFWAYKIRAMKVAARTIRSNPARALMLGVAPEFSIPGISIGSPLTDNMATVIADGRLPYSTGLDMLWSAPEMHPVGAIFN